MTKSTVEAGGTVRQAQRFTTLDGLRGFAAICVALHHFSGVIMPAGYLAVDFFFMLSGFVLVQTYQKRFDGGLTFGEFSWIRFIRLMPLHFLGVLIGAAYAVQGMVRGSDFHLDPAIFAVAFPLNSVMLPAPVGHALFPLNAPAWSLFAELLANFALALWLIRLRLPGLLVVALGGAVLLLASLWLAPLDPGKWARAESMMNSGGDWDTSYIGLFRTMFSFTLGMALAHLPLVNVRRPSLLALVYGVVLVVLLALHVPAPLRLAYDLGFVFVASPLLVYLGSRVEPNGWFAPLALFIGEMSFALYAVHMTMNHAFRHIASRWHLSDMVVAPVYVLAALTLAWCAIRWFEPFIRQILRKALHQRA